MSTAPYDETFEEFERRTGLEKFFGEYSTEVRGKLLSKNLEKPSNVYDVLYPNTRNDLMSKNIPIKSNLDRESESIRNSLLAKHVSNHISLEETGEIQRKLSIAKNELLNSSKNLENLGESARKNALAKNNSIENTLEKISNNSREDSLAKNISKNNDLSEMSESFRESSISKNVAFDSKIDDASFLHNNISKNISKETDLESESDSIRRSAESKNVSKENDLLSDSESIRNNSITKNIVNSKDLEEISNNFRNDAISKNESSVSKDIDSISNNYRADNLSKNNSNPTDLESNASSYRDNSLSKNKDKNADLETSSGEFRNLNLSQNSKNKSDLEDLSSKIRENSISKNNENKNDLETNSTAYRNNSISQNLKSNNDLEIDGEKNRVDNISKNIKSLSDLEDDSNSIRNSNLQNNVSKITDLESNSISYRNDDLSNNDPKNTDLESDSVSFRQNNASFNASNSSDLQTDSIPFLNNNISNNQSSISDLENDSQAFRNNNLSNNVETDSNLEFDSVQTRNSNLSSNIPNDSNLESDSISFINNNLSNNNSNNSDLENDSLGFLGSNVSSNVPNFSNLEVDSIPYRVDDLAHNVSGDFDLESNSILFRNDNVSNNVSNNTDLFSLSQGERNEQTSSNVSNATDLENLSNIFRNEQLAKNPSRFSLGDTINLVNTSFFVGISNLEIQGAIFREANKILNRNKKGLESVFDDDESIKFFEEKSSDGIVPGGRDYLMQKNSPSSLSIIEGGSNIIGTYGIRLVDDTSGADTGLVNFTRPKSVGSITNLISLHNIQQNTFQSRPGYNYESGIQSAIDGLRNFGSSGFQELLTITGIDKRLQKRTNTTPAEIISSNNGRYLSNDAEKILKPISEEENILGTGVSMASQTDTTDSIQTDFDRNGTRARGVRHVIDTIKKDERISFAQNFNVQGQEGNSSIFIFGKEKDGTYKKGYNRFSIKNPYAPTEALSMQFSFTNYSIPESAKRVMAFPAYVKSFQHSDKANWNSTTFLGRPEPIYTYGSSSRDGSVTFYVLTDFAAKVDIGYSFDPSSGNVTKITEDFKQKFARRRDEIEVRMKELKSEIKKYEKQIQSNETDEETKEYLRQQNQSQKEEFAELEAAKKDYNISALQNEKFYENTKEGVNVYKFIEGFQEKAVEDGDVSHKPEDTVKKLAEMKSGLMFQPAYFSGSKADFVDRMEFIAKMTRPARNNSTSDGFSFTNAPVCHIHLGDWFNHDIIINSVSYNYADAPWTLDGLSGEEGKVYPMWCEVTVSFDIIGSFGALRSEDPPLSTDTGGFFGRFRVKK